MLRLVFKVEADAEAAISGPSVSAVAFDDWDVREAEVLAEERAFVGFKWVAFLPRDGTDLSDFSSGVIELSEDPTKRIKTQQTPETSISLGYHRSFLRNRPRFW